MLKKLEEYDISKEDLHRAVKLLNETGIGKPIHTLCVGWTKILHDFLDVIENIPAENTREVPSAVVHFYDSLPIEIFNDDEVNNPPSLTEKQQKVIDYINNGDTYKQAAEKLGVSVSQVNTMIYSLRKKGHKIVSKNKGIGSHDTTYDDDVIRLTQNGYSYREIAKELDITISKVNVVQQWLKRKELREIKEEHSWRIVPKQDTQQEPKPQIEEVPKDELKGLSDCIAERLGECAVTEEISILHKEMLVEILHRIIVK